MSISEISEKTLVTVRYLALILLQLKKLGYVESKRGVQGGYLLKKLQEHIELGEVIREIEGPLSSIKCASITAYEPCSLEEGCLLKPLWTLVRDKIAYVLEQTTLDDLLRGNLRPVVPI